MSMTVVVIVVAAVLLLLLLGAGVILFVLKSRSSKSSSSAGNLPSAPPYPPAPAGHSLGSSNEAAGHAPSWPPPQSAPAQPWGGPPAGQSEAAPMPWPSFPEPAPPLPPEPDPYAMQPGADPYATTPSVDASEIAAAPNPDLFMTTPSTPRNTAVDIIPAHLKADDGSVIHLNRLAMRVGRHPECDVVIPTPGTSRQHAEFEFRDGSWFVTDLNSGNGTFVNNARVRSQQLASGDEIRIDQTRFTFGGGA